MDNYQIVSRLRKEKNISAKEFAIRCGKTSRQWTYNLEKGILKDISTELVKKFAAILDVPESTFYDNSPSEAHESGALYNPLTSNLDEITGYRDKYIYLLIENRKFMAENIKLKNIIIENKIDVTF